MNLGIHSVREKADGTKCYESTSDGTKAFLANVARARSAFAKLEAQEGRSLTSEEVLLLERQGNWATDWTQVRVSSGCLLGGRIRGNRFFGPVLIGDLNAEVAYPGAESCPHPSGLYDSSLAWCVVGDGALVKACATVTRCVIEAGAALVDCGLISSSGTEAPPVTEGEAMGVTTSASASKLQTPSCRFANGLAVAIGPETCGRELSCFATMSLSEAAAMATDRSSPEGVAKQRNGIDAFAELASCQASVICTGAAIMSCSRVVDVFIGAHACVQSSCVEEATVLSSAEEPSKVASGAMVRSSLLQHGVALSGGCIVANSLLLEYSHVDNHGKVTHSILGPDTGVAAGECHHSLLGPFVGFHHQSLLIAAVWPLGRGNVAYGANVGSNHTSRQADQEIWPGEGTFFGLSAVIKYPANYTESPFTVIASGVACLPQRVAFPFSLISAPDRSGIPGLSPGLNQLQPGWVLSNSMYMVIRNEEKFRKRARARRHRVDWPIFRPSVARLMVQARARLVAAGAGREENEDEVGDGALYIGDKAVAGLGKNYMTGASRRAGVAAYTLHLRRYALRGFLARLETRQETGIFRHDGEPCGKHLRGMSPASVAMMPPPTANILEVESLLTPPQVIRSGSVDAGAVEQGTEEGWDLQRTLLLAEYGPDERGTDELLKQLIAIEGEVTKAVEKSKAKDDNRGAQIIPGYEDAHTPAGEDGIVRLAHAQRAEAEARVLALLERIYRERECPESGPAPPVFISKSI